MKISDIFKTGLELVVTSSLKVVTFPVPQTLLGQIVGAIAILCYKSLFKNKKTKFTKEDLDRCEADVREKITSKK